MSGNTGLLGRAINVVTTTIFIEGQEVSRSFGVRSISIKQEVNRISSATVVLTDGRVADRDFEASSSDRFLPGMEIEIKAGYSSEEETLFKGIIVRHAIRAKTRQSSTLSLECQDKAVRMTVGRKSAYYSELTDSDLIEELATAYQLETEVETTPTVHKSIVKYHCTDWDFLLTRAEANGMLVFTDQGKLSVKKPDFSAQQAIAFTLGTNIKEVELEMDALHQMPGVRSLAWDHNKQELLEEEGADPGVSRLGNLDSETLSEALYKDPIALYHNAYMETTELSSWADAQLLKSRLAKIQGRIRFTGYAEIKAGDLVSLDGLGERFNGDAFVSAVEHHFHRNTWLSTLQLGLSPNWFSSRADIMSRPAAGLLPGMHGLHIGKVVQLQDDEEAGGHRVLVNIPYIQQEGGTDALGVWARLSNVFAGENRGMLFRPEVDDEVVLGFVNDDPRHAILLGSLHSSVNAAPVEASDDNFEKGIYTKGEMKIAFDDDLKSIQLETASGNSILLSEDEAGIVIQDENGNEMIFSSDGMSLDSPGDIIIKAAGDITIEGMNIAYKAQANYTAEGAAGTELSSNATTVIKGSLVQIN